MALNGLLTLRLASTLAWQGCTLPLPRSFEDLAATHLPQVEGGETVLYFRPEDLVDPTAVDGPRVLAAPGAPVATGASAPGVAAHTEAHNAANAPAAAASALPAGEADADAGTERLSIGPGIYAFLQWRAGDEDTLAEGIDYFARELWWERKATEGFWILRRVAEDGRMATQLIARLSRQEE